MTRIPSIGDITIEQYDPPCGDGNHNWCIGIGGNLFGHDDTSVGGGYSENFIETSACYFHTCTSSIMGGSAYFMDCGTLLFSNNWVEGTNELNSCNPASPYLSNADPINMDKYFNNYYQTPIYITEFVPGPD